ncbi:MAG: hypothetical protein NZM00_02400 [Anaerolinea sp.]|nr:hypothetical protein [Anaerolinea sp.]
MPVSPRLLIALCIGALLSVSAGRPASAQATPVPTIDPARSADRVERTTPQGFAQFGMEDAPVSVLVFSAIDDAPSQIFHRAGMDTLLARAADGDILVTLIPLVRGSMTNARGATRAALCASEQGAYLPYLDHLHNLIAAHGPEAFTGDRLIAAVTAINLDLGRWQECMISDRPDAVLDQAQIALDAEANFNALPYVTVAGLSAVPNPDGLTFTIDLALERLAAAQQAAQVTPTPDPEATPEPEVVVLEPLMGDRVPPPLTIDLPDGWRMGYDVLLLRDVDAIRNIPLAVYTGPVTGGQGTIVLLWGFPNLVIASPLLGEIAPDLWADGTRLLRLAVVEGGCNIGTDLRRTYSIGGLQAVGTQFAAVNCPELPDTRGWFAGLQQFDLNFIFYAFAEPIEAMNGPAEAELQAILDSVRFVRPPTPTPDPEATASP